MWSCPAAPPDLHSRPAPQACTAGLFQAWIELDLTHDGKYIMEQCHIQTSQTPTLDTPLFVPPFLWVFWSQNQEPIICKKRVRMRHATCTRTHMHITRSACPCFLSPSRAATPCCTWSVPCTTRPPPAKLRTARPLFYCLATNAPTSSSCNRTQSNS